MDQPTPPSQAAPRYRLTDTQALAALGAYLVFRTITQRIGLGVGPKLLDRAPWTIPLLNNSALLLIQAGTGTTGRPLMFAGTLAASLFLSTVAGLVLYWAGWRFGHKLAERAARPGSPWASVWNPKQVARAERWMDRYGVVPVFLGRVVELFTVPVVLVAGASDMKFRRFFAAYMAGSLVFGAGFLYIGGVAEHRWPGLKNWIAHSYGPWALRIGLVLIVVAVLAMLLGSRLQPKQDEPAPKTDPSPD